MVSPGARIAEELPRQELREQYRLAVDEYRFQVELNWKRSEYFFVLNVAILVAGVTLLSTSSSLPRGVIALVFLVGAALALVSILANHTQHGYYRAARSLKGRLEEQLGLHNLALSTTPGMGSGLSRIGQVRTFLSIMLSALVVVNLVGLAVSVAKAMDDASSDVRVAVRVDLPNRYSTRDATPLVVSRDGKVIESKTLGSDGSVFLSVPPGMYRISMYADRLCTRKVRIGQEPLQLTQLDCSP